MSDAHDNPFATSAAAARPASDGEMLPLYSETVCMVTTFFGSSVLATPLMMINAHRTGQNPFVVGGLTVAVLVGAMLVGAVLPDGIPSVAYTIAQLMVVRQIHRTYFETAVSLRQQEGIEFAPWLHAALLSLIGFTVSMLFVGLLVWAVGLQGLADL